MEEGVEEFGVLLSNLKASRKCEFGYVSLTYDNLIGEMQKGPRMSLYCLSESRGFMKI